MHLQKLPFFRNRLRPVPNLTTGPPCPTAREPISVAILLNLQRKRRVMMKYNVRNVRERWTRCREGETYPAFVVQDRCMNLIRSWCASVDGKKKVMKKRRRSIEKENERSTLIQAKLSSAEFTFYCAHLTGVLNIKKKDHHII
jgi:hypothetical protein